MDAMEIKRCPHCVGGLAAVDLHEADDFDNPDPAVVCVRCDYRPAAGHGLYLPISWT
jgi:hypothetical protein